MLIVQKFGGSSVADAEKVRRVAGIIADTFCEGNDVVVVLSAQGDTTDDLLEKAAEINDKPSKRELDMLLSTGEQISISLMAMALEKLGLPVVSLTGWQIGMLTDSNYSNARIKKISTERLRRELDKLKDQLLAGEVNGLLSSAEDINGIRILTASRGDADANALRKLGDLLRDKDGAAVAVLAAVSGEKVTLLASCGRDAVGRGVKAGDIIKAVAPIVGGKGGGKPDSAMGGGTEPDKLQEALAAAKKLIADTLAK